jgi:hypothetical protein
LLQLEEDTADVALLAEITPDIRMENLKYQNASAVALLQMAY